MSGATISLYFMGGLLTVLALITSFFILTEVIRVVRDFRAHLGDTRRLAEAEETLSTSQRPGRGAGKSRATVQRLITHFEEEKRSGTHQNE